MASIAMLALAGSGAAQVAEKPWVNFGPDGGDARRIAPDPRNHEHLYLGTANGWIYQSRDAGNSWKRLAQLGKRDDLVLDSILVDPEDSRHLIVGAWVIDRPDGGLFVSWDGGATWMNQAEMRGQSVLSLTASSSDSNVLVAGTLRGVFRSTNAGRRWTRISPEDNKEIRDVQSVAIDPRDPNVIYAGTWHLPWKTTDGGVHWENIGKPQGIVEDSDVFSIVVDPATPDTVFASACSGIYKSEDGGAMFHRIEGIPSTARRTRRLLEDPHHLDTVFAGTTEGLYRSDDAGKTWVRTTGPDVIVNDVAVDLADPSRVLIATDRGGVLASDDGGDTFHSSNGGFSARQVTAMKRDENHPSTIFVGVVNDKDWGGVFQSDNGGQIWMQRSDGLEGRDIFSLGQAADGTMIAGTSHGLFRLDAQSETWVRVVAAPGTPNARESVQSILTRPPVPIGSDLLAQTSSATPDTAGQDGTATGTAPANAAPKPKPRPAKLTAKQLAARRRAQVKKAAPPIVPTNAQVFDGSVFAIVTAGKTVLASTSVGLLTSGDDGVTWAATGPVDSPDWRFLAAAKKNVVAASLRSVEFSSDGGAMWEPLTLPSNLTQISAVAVEPSGELWVGGREGVFISADRGRTWTIPKNLYLNAVNNIFYDESADQVTITTSGNDSLVFTVQLPEKRVTFTDAGWSLRFARPMGDHLIAATLFDGIVVQPRWVVSPLATSATGSAAEKGTMAAKETPTAAPAAKQD